ncbi:MAG: histidinol dehydrogenase [Bdellovibrionales bacterium]|nr:histidinol dehydrogenase [Bdellovibrionales bacterium]
MESEIANALNPNSPPFIRVVRWKDADRDTRRTVLMRSQLNLGDAREIAREWIAKIEARGDEALVEYIRTFDDPNFELARLRVTPEDIKRAYNVVPSNVVETIRRQIEISREFHERQVPKEMQEVREFVPGVHTGWKTTPLESVGLNVPAGQVPLPTVMQILTVAAKTARVPRVVACFPPTGEHYEMLIAADISGTDEMYRVGGIAGIAAMSIGTESIQPVLKIVGPGSIYTQAAKMEVSLRGTAIDMLSGPSEALIIADESAHARYCAADILARCEHDQNACAVLATTSTSLAEQTVIEIQRQLPQLSRRAVAEIALSRYSAIVLFDTMDEVIDFANEYSAEHLEVMTQDAWKTCERIHNAGSIFLGQYAPVAIGDYASGTNHCLPTGKAPKTVSPIGVDTFLKKCEIQYITHEGLKNLEPIVSTISAIETLDGHGRSVAIRLQDDGNQ